MIPFRSSSAHNFGPKTQTVNGQVERAIIQTNVFLATVASCLTIRFMILMMFFPLPQKAEVLSIRLPGLASGANINNCHAKYYFTRVPLRLHPWSEAVAVPGELETKIREISRCWLQHQLAALSSQPQALWQRIGFRFRFELKL